jgi:uncharacterized protein YvpB
MMRLLVSRVLMMVLLVGSVALSSSTQHAVAGSFQGVDTWITIASVQPSAGCVVDVTVEVRNAGSAVAGAEVSATLVQDGALISSDFGTSGSSGLAYLAIDTGWAAAGTSARLDVNVGGDYVSGTSLTIADGGGCSGAPSMLTGYAEAWIPDPSTSAAVTTEAQESAAEDQVAFISVPTYQQQRNLSCEYAALSIATGGLGYWVSEYQFDNLVGWSANPHWGYRGDINGWWGNTTDYGVYASALVGPLSQFGFRGEAFYGQGDTSGLTARLDAGQPTLVWLGLWGETGFYEMMDDGTTYKLVPGYHVMVAYAYDDWGVYLSDPGTGTYRSYAWGDFIWMWNVLDGMALSVSPG